MTEASSLPVQRAAGAILRALKRRGVQPHRLRVAAQVEPRHSTEPAESVSGPFTVKVRPEANKVALAEFSVKPAMVGLRSSVTV